MKTPGKPMFALFMLAILAVGPQTGFGAGYVTQPRDSTDVVQAFNRGCLPESAVPVRHWSRVLRCFRGVHRADTNPVRRAGVFRPDGDGVVRLSPVTP